MNGLLKWALIGLLALAPGAAASAPGDVAGAEDHPAVTRYPGAVILWQAIDNHSPYRLAVGPVTGYRHIDDWVETAGRVTRTYYELEGTRTHSEVFANYRQALADNGFDLLAEGMEPGRNTGQAPGGRTWLGVYFAENPVADPDGIVRLLHGSATVGGSGFVAGVRQRAEGRIFIAAAVTQQAENRVAILVDVVEEAALEADLVTVNAEAMGKDMDDYGRVVLDGLFFAHDEAVLTPESAPALAEIARFLAMRPEAAFYVVGHTDGTGSFAYNSTLSEQRAAAVVAALVAEHGVAAERLEAHGVGPLVPVFTNASEAGRGKNRRVELVER